jgi:exodeoxyribonuclease VII large subunit
MTKRSGSGDGELLLGFDMAPVLPGKKKVPSVLNAVPAVQAEELPRSSAPVPTDLVPDSPSPITHHPDLTSKDPEVFSVTRLTRHIADLLEDGIGSVWVEGEISNLRVQSSGHSYFTLKDASSQLSCVLFARTASGIGIRLRDGQRVQLQGKIGVYEPRGQYQLIVRLVQEKGVGLLQARFEELKRRLDAEGLFATERKRPLPRFPGRIGVVTSPTGAAIRDFLNVLHRRHPGLRVVIHPVRVQGKGAAAEIAAAISEFSTGSDVLGAVDVVVVTRGGGSIEDLWEFNEEVVARAIASCSVPVVSAVGHEIDFTIADFAADFRAPTPSAAAEILAADGGELLERCRALAVRIGREAVTHCERLISRTDLAFSSTLFREPARRIAEIGQTLDRAEEDLEGVLGNRLDVIRNRLSTSEIQLSSSRPDHQIAVMRQQVIAVTDRLENHLQRLREREAGRLARVEATLSALSPEATLRRGFSITRSADGRVLTSASQVNKGDQIFTQLAEGEIESKVRD